MLATLLLATVAGGQPLVLAAGQESLYTAHVQDFPKAGWVVGGLVPVSSSPQLAGRMVDLLQPGTFVEVAGLGNAVPRPGRAGALDEVFAVPVRDDPQHPAGFVQAKGLAVLETVLGRCGTDGFLFTTVVGREMRPGSEGLFLTLEVWVKRDGEPPEHVLGGVNSAPGAKVWFAPGGGAAVVLGEAVALVSADGHPSWRSPEGETWRVLSADARGVTVTGPRGRQVLRP